MRYQTARAVFVVGEQDAIDAPADPLLRQGDQGPYHADDCKQAFDPFPRFSRHRSIPSCHQVGQKHDGEVTKRKVQPSLGGIHWIKQRCNDLPDNK